jgi:hypothetical protein
MNQAARDSPAQAICRAEHEALTQPQTLTSITPNTAEMIGNQKPTRPKFLVNRAGGPREGVIWEQFPDGA